MGKSLSFASFIHRIRAGDDQAARELVERQLEQIEADDG